MGIPETVRQAVADQRRDYAGSAVGDEPKRNQEQTESRCRGRAGFDITNNQHGHTRSATNPDPKPDQYRPALRPA
jgi:hypothetical protein